MQEEIVPQQFEGNKTDNQVERKFSSPDEAKENYKIAVKKLKDISHWAEIADGISGGFLLTDTKGQEVKREPQIGDLIRISLPAPDNLIGDGNDWVRIEAIEQKKETENDIEIFSLRIRPTQSPFSQKEDIAHFYTDDSTNTFIVEREKDTIRAGVHGRNEVPNYEQTSGLNKLRNHVIAIGAMIGLANPQWKNLSSGLVDKKSE